MFTNLFQLIFIAFVTDKMEEALKKLALILYEIEAVKFGEFETKIGLMTPIYFDLRVIIAYPKVMVNIHSGNICKVNIYIQY